VDIEPKRTPASRRGNVDELTGAAVFLSGDASSFVKEHALYVDVGITTCLQSRLSKARDCRLLRRPNRRQPSGEVKRFDHYETCADCLEFCSRRTCSQAGKEESRSATGPHGNTLPFQGSKKQIASIAPSAGTDDICPGNQRIAAQWNA